LTFESGQVSPAQHIIVAVDEDAAGMLRPGGTARLAPARSTTCLYFGTKGPMSKEPILHLDGDLTGPVNHACVLSAVAPEYAPPGHHLISCSVIGSPSSAELENVVRAQMRGWFGNAVDDWRHLRTYQIRNAIPATRQMHVGPGNPPVEEQPGIYYCGDHMEDPTLNGALLSGVRAADRLLQHLNLHS
jgi:hypothetical protein